LCILSTIAERHWRGNDNDAAAANFLAGSGLNDESPVPNETSGSEAARVGRP